MSDAFDPTEYADLAASLRRVVVATLTAAGFADDTPRAVPTQVAQPGSWRFAAPGLPERILLDRFSEGWQGAYLVEAALARAETRLPVDSDRIVKLREAAARIAWAEAIAWKHQIADRLTNELPGDPETRRRTWELWCWVLYHSR